MHGKMTWVLLLLVLVVGGAGWYLQGQEEKLEAETNRELVPGLDRYSIRGIRIDNLERSLQIKLERRDEGWFLVDPLEYPAAPSVVTQLLDGLTDIPAIRIEGVEPESVGLEPPRFVVQVESDGPGGPRTSRVEVGSEELDRQRVFVRVEGVLLKTLANLSNTLNRELYQWRDPRLSSTGVDSVESFRRRGSYAFEDDGEEFPLDFDAHLDPDHGWFATSPRRAILDIGRTRTYLVRALSARASLFEDDALDAFTRLGLDEPTFTLELELRGAKRETLVFRENDGVWLAGVEGRHNVFRVEDHVAWGLMGPLEPLTDPRLVSIVRDSIDGFRLLRDPRTAGANPAGLHFRREGVAWFVSGGSHVSPSGPESLADKSRVEEVLGTIERAMLVELLEDGAFPESEAVAGFFVSAAGREYGGHVGEPIETPAGAKGHRFLRAGDGMRGVVDPEVADLTQLDLDHFRVRELHRLNELEAVWVELRQGETHHKYLRNSGNGRWTREGVRQEAVDFALLVDPLLLVRALEFAPGVDPGNLEDPVEVELMDVGSIPHRFTLGTFEGRTYYRTPQTLAVVDGELHRSLLRLLEDG